MSSLFERIKAAQIRAREQAAIVGLSGSAITMAGVHAAEQVVIADIRRLEAAAAVPLDEKIIYLASRRSRRCISK